jgi:L-threonylcarbamoyladenylate synthase
MNESNDENAARNTIPGRDASMAAELLLAGQVLILPTETVYGLCADATNDDAVARLYAAKGRPRDNPIAMLVPDAPTVLAHCPVKEPAARDIVTRLSEFWPGPLTILLPHGDRFSEVLTAGSPFAGFRVPDHPATLDILHKTARPVAATSANLSGDPSPRSAPDAVRALTANAELVDGYVDGGPCGVGVESSVVRIAEDGSGIFIMRQGALGPRDFERIGIAVRK